VSRVPEATVRRVARLGRRAHAFHRYAHHPLCEAYANEVWHVGRRMRVCKGCTLVALGALAGVAIGSARQVSALSMAVDAAALAVAVLAVAVPAARGTAGKLVSRFLLAFLLADVAAHGVFRADALGVLLGCLAMAVAAIGIAAHRKRGPWRVPCTACEEGLAGDAVCTGFREQLRREKAVIRLSARWIAREANTFRVGGEQ
jgi:hypothetical protein